MMNELPSAGSVLSKHPKARKEHICIECRKPIKKGQQYWYFEGVYAGKWESFKTCLRCEKVREQAEVKYKANWDEGPAFGELYYWIKCCKGLL